MINSQIKLTGLKVSQSAVPASGGLTSPNQLMQKAASNPAPTQSTATNPTANQPLVANPVPETPVSKTKGALAKADEMNITNIVSSGLAGGIASGMAANRISTIAESIRGVNVQASMERIRMTEYSGGGYGGGYGGGGYYGGTEMYRPGGMGRVEFLNRPGAHVEYDSYGNPNGTNSAEMNLATRNVFRGGFDGVKYGMLIGGAVSAVTNGYKVLTGKATGAEAVGSAAADTITAGVSGGAGAIAGGFASLGLGLVGIAGVPGLILATGIGAAGAVGGQLLLQKSGIYDSIKEKVSNMVTKK